jgi:hypothetical protein
LKKNYCAKDLAGSKTNLMNCSMIEVKAHVMNSRILVNHVELELQVPKITIKMKYKKH